MTVPVKDSVKINFAGGLNTKTDPKQLDASQFIAINNAVYTTEGRLTKRNGFGGSFTTTVSTPIPALTYSAVPNALTAARKVFSYNNELLLNDAWNLYSWDSNASTWNYKGRSTMVSLSTSNVVAGATSWRQCDSSIDTTTGVKIFAYSDGAGVYYSIQDITTGQFVINQAAYGTNNNYVNPRCVSISGKSWITAVNTQDGFIYKLAIVGQSVSGSATSFITNLHALYTFTVTAASATVGATYTNNFHTFTVVGTIAAGTTLVTTGIGGPSLSGAGTLTKTSGTGDATITFTAVTASQQLYDIDVDVNTGNIYVAWFTTSGTISIAAVSSSFVIGNTITKSETASNGLSWFGDGTNIWVVYNNGAATKAFIVNNAVNATTLAPTVVDSSGLAINVNNVTGVWSSTQNKAFIFYDLLQTQNFGLTTTAEIYYNTLTVGGVAGTPLLFMGSVSISSKAFVINGIPHLMSLYTYFSVNGLISTVAIQATNFLLNLYNVTSTMGGFELGTNTDVTANIVAKISPDQASQVAPPAGILPGVHQNSSGAWELAALMNVNYAFETTPYTPYLSPTGVIDVQLDFSLSNPDVQILGNNAQISGGQISMYDAVNLVEQNFHIYPNVASNGVPANMGGNLGLSGSNSLYGYIYTYEWIDGQGQVHRSFPSPVQSPVASGHDYSFASGTTTGQITLTVPNLRVTNKTGEEVVIGIYRTVANGSIYYLVPGTASFGTVINNPGEDSQTFIDTVADSTIINNIQLYTTGALGYYAAPASSVLTNFKNRAIQVSYENPYQLGYSNEILQNFPVQFVPEFLQNIGTVGGPLTTVAQMDDKLILFKNGKISGPAIYYMQGNGPAASGANNDFQDPLPIAVDAGCVDRPSVVLTPVGLMFKSDKGIYLLDRGLQAMYIGAPVESYNQYSVLTAQLIPNSTQVRFWLSNGTLLMYDYFFKKWATWTPPAGISDCIFQGQHTYVTSAGQVYQETPGTYVDGTVTPILMSFTTAWIKLAGLQGYQRAYFFYLLAQYISAHTLSLSLYTDFSTSPDSTVTITPRTNDTLENWRIFFTKQRCQAFQIQLTENYTGTLGQGFNMSGLNLIAGVKSKFRTISAAQSTG